MTSVTREQVQERLKTVTGPDFESDVVSLGLVSDIFIADGKVFFSITVPAARADALEPMRLAAEKAVKEIPGVTGALVTLTAEKKGGRTSDDAPPPPKPQARPAAAPAQHRHPP
ncbi:iron-sulfur cluster assembly protein, partial [Brucella anthropi]